MVAEKRHVMIASVRQSHRLPSVETGGQATMAETATLSRRLIPAGRVADKLGICPRTVFRLAEEGRIPFGVKVGASRRWDETQLDSWIAGGCKPTSQAG
jgi:excisionase family DNA binding protein